MYDTTITYQVRSRFQVLSLPQVRPLHMLSCNYPSSWVTASLVPVARPCRSPSSLSTVVYVRRNVKHQFFLSFTFQVYCGSYVQRRRRDSFFFVVDTLHPFQSRLLLTVPLLSKHAQLAASPDTPLCSLLSSPWCAYFKRLLCCCTPSILLGLPFVLRCPLLRLSLLPFRFSLHPALECLLVLLKPCLRSAVLLRARDFEGRAEDPGFSPPQTTTQVFSSSVVVDGCTSARYSQHFL